jgi:heme/copper-type cytochrome/quinol oxidase subunit 4
MKNSPAKAKTVQHKSHQSSIDMRVVVIMLTIIATVVFLWGFINRSAEKSNASSPEMQRTIITRPGENDR